MTKNAKILALSEMLDAEMSRAVPSDSEAGLKTSASQIARTSFRIPEPVHAELAALAAANRMSTSLLLNLLIDNYLRSVGRSGYAELAPWYPGYVLRKEK